MRGLFVVALFELWVCHSYFIRYARPTQFHHHSSSDWLSEKLKQVGSHTHHGMRMTSPPAGHFEPPPPAGAAGPPAGGYI